MTATTSMSLTDLSRPGIPDRVEIDRTATIEQRGPSCVVSWSGRSRVVRAGISEATGERESAMQRAMRLCRYLDREPKHIL